MKTTLGTISLVVLLAGNSFAGPETIIRQRARELSNQNNVRQGVAPPAPAAKPSTPPATAIGRPPGMARLDTDLAAVKVNVPVPVTQNQYITQDLLAMASGAKPSSAAAAKVANDISAALASKALSAADRARLIQDLNATLNPAKLQPLQLQAVLADVQAIFQANGLARNRSAAIAADAKALALEIQRSSK